MKFSIAAVLTALVAPVSATVFFKEDFNDDGWSSRWTIPTGWKGKSDMGEWKHTHGEWYGLEADKGIQTGPDARFFGLSAPMASTFTSDSNTLVIQYSVKHEQDLDCGGAYIKLLPGGDSFDADKFGGDTPYAVMFGPDVCGSSNKKTHVILHYDPKDENFLIKKEVPTETDNMSHLYTFILNSDNTFEVRVDGKAVREGKLEEEFDFLGEKEIKDPDASKPDDWVDAAKMPDPEAVKPEGYDDQAEEIADPDATKPDDWDDEDDGEWEPPMIDNPDYQGEWKPKMIDNPDYKGKWVHPKIPNPDYTEDDGMYKVCKDGCTHVGFELWQVKTGTLFDDIIVTDSIEEAEAFAQETFYKKKDGEKEMYDKQQDLKRAAEDDEPDEDDLDMGDMGDFGGMGDEF